MKRILLLFAAICSLQVAVAQKTIGKLPYDSVKVGGLKPNATYYDAVVKIEKGKLISDVVKADSISYIPLRDTLFTPERIGAMTVRPQDLTNYICLSVTPGTKKWFKNSIIISADLPLVISDAKISTPASDYNQDGYLAAIDYTRFDSATRRWKIKTSTMYPYSYLYNVNIGDTIATSYKLNVKGTLNTTADALINGLTVGQGAGGSQSVVLGFEAGLLNTGIENTLIGHQAGKTNSGLLMVNIGYLNGNNNTGSNGGAVAIGASSFVNRSGGLYNIAIGYNTMTGGGNGGNNVAVGKASQNGNGSFANNSSLGTAALNVNIADNNVAVGYNSGFLNTTGARNIFLGSSSGYNNSTASDQLFVNNFQTASYAEDQSKSLLYGNMSSTTSNQLLRINANVGIGGVAAATGDDQLKFGGTSNTNLRINGTNSSSGSSAGIGMLFNNDVADAFLFYQGSSTNAYIANGAYMRSSGVNGFKFAHDGVGSKIRWSTSGASGLSTGVYMSWDATSFAHKAIPQADDMTNGKTILVYDTANNGAFKQIKIDSITKTKILVVSSQFDKTNTTLSNITDLSSNVSAGKTYQFEAILYTTSDVAGGVKFAIAGTATATNIIYEANVVDAGVMVVPGTTRSTALATTVGNVTAVTAATVKINGTIIVNAAGTLIVQFAENAATATSSILVGSTFKIYEIQ